MRDLKGLPDLNVALVQTTLAWHDRQANFDHFCLRIAPFDEHALIAHLQKFGLELELPVRHRYGAQGDGPSLYLHDPDGNRVELKGPSPAA